MLMPLIWLEVAICGGAIFVFAPIRARRAYRDGRPGFHHTPVSRMKRVVRVVWQEAIAFTLISVGMAELQPWYPGALGPQSDVFFLGSEISAVVTVLAWTGVYPKRWTTCQSFDVNEARGVTHDAA